MLQQVTNLESAWSPRWIRYMTHMLAGLANGRMVVALEVSPMPLKVFGSGSMFLPNKGWL